MLCGFTIGLQFRGVYGFLDFLRVRHLLRGVADEHGRHADQEAHPGQPQQAMGVTVVQRCPRLLVRTRGSDFSTTESG
jgi:hypothetical protein